MPYCLPAGSGEGREKGRTHSLLAKSIQKDADSRSEVRRGGRSYVRGRLQSLSHGVTAGC